MLAALAIAECFNLEGPEPELLMDRVQHSPAPGLHKVKSFSKLQLVRSLLRFAFRANSIA